MINPTFNFDFHTLEAFIKENIDFLLGARFQKIQQPTRQELVFGIRNQGETRKLYVNINPKFFHVCFMSKENEAKRFIEIPSKPPMFCMLLRKYLESAKIAKVEQPEGERILEFYFETYNELSEKIYLCLAIELMGKHSNVVLYNYDTNMIIGCAHNVGVEKSSVREIIGGLPYAYPPRKNNKIISGLSSLYKPNFMPLPSTSPPVGEVCLQLEQKTAKVRKQGEGNSNQPGSIHPSPEVLALVPHAELLPSPTRGEGTEQLYLTVNDFIDNYFAPLQEAEKVRALKSKLSSAMKAKLKKINNSFIKMQKQSTSVEKAENYRKKGDLIMANLYHNKDFSPQIEVTDYETNSILKIVLDETKTLKENANQFFKLYNKAKTANLKTSEMIENLQREKEYLEQVLYSLEFAENMTELLEIGEEVGKEGKKAGGQEGKQKKNLSPLTNLLTFHLSPFTIYVGKNNKQNDYIVSKLSRDEDIWFHVHNCAGSHVLLRVESGQEPTDEVIFECAKLAKEYSAGKNSSKVGVIYTKRKFLKKPPGANLGYVIYKNEKEIIID